MSTEPTTVKESKQDAGTNVKKLLRNGGTIRDRSSERKKQLDNRLKSEKPAWMNQRIETKVKSLETIVEESSESTERKAKELFSGEKQPLRNKSHFSEEERRKGIQEGTLMRNAPELLAFSFLCKTTKKGLNLRPFGQIQSSQQEF